jgi:CrcB protein
MSFSWAMLGWIALGGAAGSVSRGLIAMALPSRFPWATLLINVAGSMLIGWLMARVGGLEPEPAARWRAVLVTGFCGGFTTFSTFSWQTFEQLQKGEWSAAVANVALSLVLCLAGTWLGFRLGHA